MWIHKNPTCVWLHRICVVQCVHPHHRLNTKLHVILLFKGQMPPSIHTRTQGNRNHSNSRPEPAQVAPQSYRSVAEQIPRVASKLHYALTLTPRFPLGKILGQVKRRSHCKYTRYVHGCMCFHCCIHSTDGSNWCQYNCCPLTNLLHDSLWSDWH